jgi:hypothetical protein
MDEIPDDVMEAAWACVDEYVDPDLVPVIARAILAERSRHVALQQNLRDAFDALCAMRNSINEHIPMPSLESDLLHGPETTVFCSVVAETVINSILAERERCANVVQDEGITSVDLTSSGACLRDGRIIARINNTTQTQ